MNRMKKEEIQELLDLKGWSKRCLALKLGLSENAVYRWFIDRSPGGPASLVMRQWLASARKENATPAPFAEAV